MNAKSLVLNMSAWLILAFILAFLLEPLNYGSHVDLGFYEFDIGASDYIIWFLIAQTTLSLNGFSFSKEKLLNKKAMIHSVVLTYVVNSGITLLIAVAFYFAGENEAAYGFSMLAAMPCAISVITAATVSGNDQEKAVACVAYSYIAGLLLTPLISYLTISSAVNPFEVFMYILMFIVLPVIFAIVLNRVKIPRNAKIIAINFFVGAIIFVCLNKNNKFILEDLDLAAIMFAVSFARVFVLHYVVKYYIIKAKIDKDIKTCYLVMGVWKTTGMAITMCMLILGDVCPLAVVPCIMSVMVENVWFSWAIKKGDMIFEGPFFHFRGFFDKPAN